MFLPDGRTVTFTTAPQPWRTRYGLTLPGIAARDDHDDTGSTTEMSFDLGGVHAEWIRDGDAKPTWVGWLPHIDTNVVRTMTAQSAEHERLLRLLQEPGRLEMRTQLLLPGRTVSLRLECSGEFAVKCGTVETRSKPGGRRFKAEWTVKSSKVESEHNPRGNRQQVLPTEEMRLEIGARTGSARSDFLFDASYHADFDPYERALRLEHFFVPWAPTRRPSEIDERKRKSDDLIVGDPENGRKIFFGKEANCASCHTYGGRGGKVAADLTVTVHRTPESVLRDILEPSAAINPDYVSYTVLTDSGNTLTGLFQSADERQITLIDAAAKNHHINRDEIEDIRPSPVSLMPKGYEKLGKKELAGLGCVLMH